MAMDSTDFEVGGKKFLVEQFGDKAPWEVKFENFIITGSDVNDVINAVKLAANAVSIENHEATLVDIFRRCPGIEAKKTGPNKN